MSFFTEEELTKVWGNANFGPEGDNKEAFILKALIKRAQHFSTGSTIHHILVELGLLKEIPNAMSMSCWSWTEKAVAFLQHQMETPTCQNCEHFDDEECWIYQEAINMFGEKGRIKFCSAHPLLGGE